MAAGPEPTPQRRALAAALRDLRTGGGISGRELARRLGWTQAKVSRIETATTIPSADDIEAWLGVVDGGDRTAQELADLADRAAAELRDWRLLFRAGYGPGQAAVGEVLHASTALSSFQPTMVPGLLQTAEYAADALRVWDPDVGDDQVAEYVAGRLRNQALLDSPRSFEFIVTEGALRWRPGTVASLRFQLGYVRLQATRGNISLGVIPFATRAPIRYLHGFNLYERPDDAGGPLVDVETYADLLTASGPGKVDAYRQVLDRARAGALWGDDALAFLDRLIAELQEPA